MYAPQFRSPAFLGRLGRRRSFSGMAGYRPNQAVARTYTRRASLQGIGNGYVLPPRPPQRRRLGQDDSDDFSALDFSSQFLSPESVDTGWSAVPAGSYSSTPAVVSDGGAVFASVVPLTVPQGVFQSSSDIVPGATAPLQTAGVVSYTAPLQTAAQVAAAAAAAAKAISPPGLNPTAPGWTSQMNPSLGISNGTLLLGLGAIALFALSGGGGRRR